MTYHKASTCHVIVCSVEMKTNGLLRVVAQIGTLKTYDTMKASIKRQCLFHFFFSISSSWNLLYPDSSLNNQLYSLLSTLLVRFASLCFYIFIKPSGYTFIHPETLTSIEEAEANKTEQARQGAWGISGNFEQNREEVAKSRKYTLCIESLLVNFFNFFSFLNPWWFEDGLHHSFSKA